MNKIHKLLLAMSLFMGMCTTTFAEKGDYLNAQLAIADVDGFSDGLAVIASYGLPMRDVHKNFSVEGELSMSLVDPDTTVAGTAIDVSYITFGGYGVYTHPVNDKFSLSGRAGLVFSDVDANVGGTNVSVDDGLDLSLGFNVNYSLNRDIKIIAGYTIINDDISHLAAGVQYKF